MSNTKTLELLSAASITLQDLEALDPEDVLQTLLFLYNRTATLHDIPPEGFKKSFKLEWVSLYNRFMDCKKAKIEDVDVDEALDLLVGKDKELESLYLLVELIREHFEQLNALMYLLGKTPDNGKEVVNSLQTLVDKFGDDPKALPFKAPLVLSISKIKETQELARALDQFGLLIQMAPLGGIQ